LVIIIGLPASAPFIVAHTSSSAIFAYCSTFCLTSAELKSAKLSSKE
jgi:hypothetical protein